MTIAVVHPGAAWAVSDVEAGLAHGLAEIGVSVIRQPLVSDLARALRTQSVDAAIVVCGHHADPAAVAAVRAICPVYLLATETPYDLAAELAWAARVDGGWTHERTAVERFRAVNPRWAYLAHGWHPEIHRPDPLPWDMALPAHDVVLVGAGFPERITWLNAMDWTGIDLGLYGIWEGFGLSEALEPCIQSGPIPNLQAAALYRRARLGINLYRRTSEPAESLNPRAYEMAACGLPYVTQARAESVDVFGGLVPMCETPAAMSAAVRAALAQPRDSARAAVATASWTERARTVLADVQAWATAGV